MSRYVEARSLRPGDRVDVPADIAAGTANEGLAEFVYAQVERVNGGWADGCAVDGEVVIYAPNFPAPIICDAGYLFEVEEDE